MFGDFDGSLVVVGFCCFEKVELMLDGLWRICCGGLTLVGLGRLDGCSEATLMSVDETTGGDCMCKKADIFCVCFSTDSICSL